MHKIDAKNKVLGRLAVEVANLLRGKGKPEFMPHNIDAGDPVTVYNTDKVKLTGKKEDQKKYYHHSGYPGGIKEVPFKKAMQKDSREVVRKAVYGMLPKNKLRDRIIKNLKLFKEEVDK